jgi:hypothetical protein
MFNPNAQKAEKAQKAARVKAIKQIKDWCNDIIPAHIKEGMVLDVNEIVCGDPMCAPVDTVFTMVWPSGGKGMFALPLMASEVLEEDLRYNFPVSFPSA